MTPNWDDLNIYLSILVVMEHIFKCDIGLQLWDFCVIWAMSYQQYGSLTSIHCHGRLSTIFYSNLILMIKFPYLTYSSQLAWPWLIASDCYYWHVDGWNVCHWPCLWCASQTTPYQKTFLTKSDFFYVKAVYSQI